MKLLEILETIINEDEGSIDVRMFALFAHVFDELYKGLQKNEMDETYEYLKKFYRGQNRIALEYFYDYLKKNKDRFLKKDQTLSESSRKEILHKYWDEKGIESAPIYHLLNLNPRNDEDKAEILKIKMDYFGGVEKVKDMFTQEVLTGKPVMIEVGGYTIEYLVTFVEVFTFDWTRGLYYEIDGLINGDTSFVTIFHDGETYNIGELFRGETDFEDGQGGDEIGYEISDSIRDYYDEIGKKYSLDGDSVDYQVVDGQKFKQSIDK